MGIIPKKKKKERKRVEDEEPRNTLLLTHTQIHTKYIHAFRTMAEKESDDVGGDNHSIASNEMKSKTHYYVSKQQSQ